MLANVTENFSGYELMYVPRGMFQEQPMRAY